MKIARGFRRVSSPAPFVERFLPAEQFAKLVRHFPCAKRFRESNAEASLKVSCGFTRHVCVRRTRRLMVCPQIV